MSWSAVRRSIRWKFCLRFSAVLFACLFVFSLLVYFLLDYQLKLSSRDYLNSAFERFSRSIKVEHDGASGIAEVLSLATGAGSSGYRLGYVLKDHQGYVLAESEEESVQAKRPILRGLVDDAAGARYELELSLDDALRRSVLGALVWLFAALIPIGAFFSVLGGWILSRKVLEPVSAMTNAAKRISIANTEERLPLRGSGDELDRLAETFNDVFGRLREAYHRVSQFTADASHELRLPITAIKGEAEVTLERARNVEDYQRVLTSILEEFNRLSRLTNRLLQLARADAGEQMLERHELDVAPLVRKLAEFYRPLAEDKKIRMSAEALRENVIIRGDALKLEELFSNLIENAIKYTPAEGEIALKASQEEGFWRIDVRDTGIGIPLGEQKKIFERFYRVDKSRSRDRGGDGLGLSIVETIAKAHGGHVRVESLPGSGSTFSVFLPSLD